MEIMSRGAPAPKETPAQEIRKAMKNDDGELQIDLRP